MEVYMCHASAWKNYIRVRWNRKVEWIVELILLLAYIVSRNDTILFALVTASVATCLKAADIRCTFGYTSSTVPGHTKSSLDVILTFCIPRYISVFHPKKNCIFIDLFSSICHIK
jgi:hypothetical protein